MPQYSGLPPEGKAWSALMRCVAISHHHLTIYTISFYRRRCSPPVMISISEPASDFNGARTSAAKIIHLRHPGQAAVTGQIRMKCGVCASFGAPPLPEHPAPDSRLKKVLHVALAGMTAEQVAERCNRIVPQTQSALGES